MSNYTLIKQNNHLTLQSSDKTFGKPFFVEFNPMRYKHPAKELLIKAIGAKKSALPTVCDLTAGFGQDAYLMHSYGCAVQLVERSPVIAQLLEDGLRRAQCDLPLFIGDARKFIENCVQENQQFDVVYFDPIFPQKTKTALASKSARLLRALAGEDMNAAEIFMLARQIARKRIVVKRPRYGECIITQPAPDVVYTGASVRFDVYLNRS